MLLEEKMENLTSIIIFSYPVNPGNEKISSWGNGLKGGQLLGEKHSDHHLLQFVLLTLTLSFDGILKVRESENNNAGSINKVLLHKQVINKVLFHKEMMKGSPLLAILHFQTEFCHTGGENSGGASLGKELPAELRFLEVREVRELRFLVRSQTVS